MKHLKKLFISTVIIFVLSILFPNVFPPTQLFTVNAAIKINKKKVALKKGKKIQLKIIGTKKKAKWSSNKKSVATVSSKGKVTAKRKGTAVITAKVGKKKYKCKITVLNPVIRTNTSIPVKYFYFCPQNPKTGKKVQCTTFTTSLIEGDFAYIPFEIIPSNATDKTVTWSSSDDKIVSVLNGKITAHKLGSALITATCGGNEAVCTVKVRMNNDEAKQNIKCTTFSIGSKTFIALKNNYKYPVGLDCTTEYFKNGSTVYRDWSICDFLAPENTCIFQAELSGNVSFDDCKTQFSVYESKKELNISGISCNMNPTSDGVEAEFINTSPSTGNSQRVKAVFYKNGAIYHITSEEKIYIKNVGSKENVKFSYPLRKNGNSECVPEIPDSFKICIDDIVVYTGTP